MEFMVDCPVDGPIEVSLEDVETVVLHEAERAEVIFVCPECGTRVSVTVRVPSFLMAAIEAMAEDSGGYVAPLAGIVALTTEAGQEPSAENEESSEAYCEYFRRQLNHVETVDDILREIGCDKG